MKYQVDRFKHKFIDSKGNVHKFFNGLLGAEIRYKNNCYCLSQHPNRDYEFLLVDLRHDNKYWYKAENQLFDKLDELLTRVDNIGE